MKTRGKRTLMKITLLPFFVALLCGCSLHQIVSSSSEESSSIEGEKSVPVTIRDVGLASGDHYLPSIGEAKLLVIPVTLTDFAFNATEENRESIEKAFFGSSEETSWESVSSFYEKSSYGKSHLSGEVSSWFPCGYSSSEVASFTDDSSPDFDPTWKIAKEAVEWYKKTYETDCKDLDSDDDGFIDGLCLIYSAPNYKKKSTLSKSLYWGFTYSLYDTDEGDIESPLPYRYMWASYDFAYAGYGNDGVDAHTYIHETGHLYGLTDYYVSSVNKNTERNYSPMGGVDMMDCNIIDHNVFSKMLLGWCSPQIAHSSGSFSLKPYEEGGDCLLVPTDKGWNSAIFDEYMLIEFYTPTGLNEKDSDSPYPGNARRVQGYSKPGIRIYHVDARLAALANSTNPFYTDYIYQNSNVSTYLAHNNSSGYNIIDPEYRLIQLMDCTEKRNFDMDYNRKDSSSKFALKAYADDSSLFYEGDAFSFSAYKTSFPNVRYRNKASMNNGYTFSKTIEIASLSNDFASIVIG